MGHFTKIHFCLERSLDMGLLVCMFYTKDIDSFENCLRKNDVIPTLEERQRIKKELSKVEHRKIITILIAKIAILIAKIAMLVAKIIIPISKNSGNI